MSIQGPGANLLTVSGGGASRVFILDGGAASVSRLTVTDGMTTSNGGGFLNYGNLTLNDVAVRGNTAQTGGGIFTQAASGSASLTLLNSTVNANTADYCGGVASTIGANNTTVTTEITNSTIADNSATESQVDSGILIQSATSGTVDALTLTDSTVAGNNEGGIFLQALDAATVTFLAQGSLIAGNAVDDIDNAGATVDSTSDFNLVGDGSGGLPTAVANGNQLGVSPLLGTLGYYGGPTQTIPLLPGSPAIGAGVVVSGITVDQRGMPRKAAPDIGAYESRSPVVTVADAGGTYNGNPFAATATVAGLIAGVDTTPGSVLNGVGLTLDYVNTDTNTDLGSTAPTNAGDYRVTASFAGSTSYAATSASATFTIAKASLSVAAVAESKQVQTSDSALTYTITAGHLAAGDSLSGALTRDTGEATGSYNISQGTLTAGGNYNLNFTGSVLYITTTAAAIADSQTVTVSSSGGTSTATTASGANDESPRVTAQASGFDGLLTTVKFTSSPALASDSAASAYFDVHATGSNLGSGAVDLTFANQTPNSALMYWTGSDWRYVTDASGKRVRTDSNGTATLSVTVATTPAITALSGQYFQVGQAEADSLVVDTTQDVVNATDNLTSLREALAYAESLGGNQTITFASSLAGQTVDLTTIGDSTDFGNSALAITGDVTIDGSTAPGLTIARDATAPDFRLFYVSANASLTLDGVTLSGGVDDSDYGGGAVLNEGSATLTDDTLTGNTGNGGGLYNDTGGTATLTDVTLTGNSTGETGGGGGLNNLGTATLTDVTLANNSAGQEGRGVLNGGMATLTNVTLTNDSAAYGGGLKNDGTVTVADVIFDDNSAGQEGGGLKNEGTATLTDVTLANNSAGQEGGGLYNDTGAGATLTNVTCSNNLAPDGGGLYNNGGTATLNNTIVAGNYTTGSSYADSPSEIFGTVTGSDNLIGDPNSAGGLSNGTDGNIVGQNASPISLSAVFFTSGGVPDLANYGGPTQTIALVPGSPAIDAGSNALAVDANGNPLTTDQRGEPRMVNGTVDIGAFESQGFTLNVSGGNDQSAVVGQAFGNPLALTITANNPVEPVGGGTITFTAPGAGASATLSAVQATIAVGSASVGATANAVGGAYQVTASATGATAVAFDLTNLSQPSFAGLASATITYGDASIRLGGSLTVSGTPVPGSVQVTIAGNGITPLSGGATLQPDGSFSTTIDTASLPAYPDSPYTVTYSFAAQGVFLSASDSSTTLTVNPATPQFSGLTASQAIVFGTTSISLAGDLTSDTGVIPPGSVAITIDGTTEYAAIAANGSFSTIFPTSTIAAAPNSPYTITYGYSSSGNSTTDFTDATDTTTTLTLNKATPTVSVSDGGGTYKGTGYAAAATVTGVSGVAGTTLESISPSIEYEQLVNGSYVDFGPNAPVHAGC